MYVRHFIGFTTFQNLNCQGNNKTDNYDIFNKPAIIDTKGAGLML